MYTEKTFQNLIDYWGKRTPDREAIFDGQQRISYGELKEEVQQLASALTLLEIGKGDKIIVMLPNWYEFIAIYMAIAKIGAIAVPCNCALRGKELEDRIHMIDPKAIFVFDPSQLSWLKENYDFPFIFTVRFKDGENYAYSDLLQLGQLLIIDESSIFDQIEVIPEEDVFAILFTSGSTGKPKGVQITANGLFKSAKKMGIRLKCTGHDNVLVPLPCGHTFGLLGVMMSFYFGTKLVLMERHRPLEALKLIEQENITVHLGVPTMFIRELEQYQIHKVNVSSLKTGIVAGASCPENIMKQLCWEFDFELLNLYGSTEALNVCMTELFDKTDSRFQTSGRILNGVEVKLAIDEGPSVDNRFIGELLVKGDGLMKGYYQMPTETAQVIDEEGWYHTGDLATVDKAGNIKIVGRKKDLIIRGGNNIVPAEVESVFLSHPSVSEVSVFGLSDNILGEQTCACITLKENSIETEVTLKEFAKGKIAKYKIPDHIIILESMPKLDIGKVNKKFLVEYSNNILSLV